MNVFILAVMLSLPAALYGQSATGADAPFLRAQRLVSDGNGEAGRAIVDSMVRIATPGSSELADALFWRATLATDAAAAERDYRRIIVEHPLYFRAGDALLRMAQLEIARGNQDAALIHLRRIALEHSGGSNRAIASYWTARALFEKNDTPGACAAVTDARSRAVATDVELINQIDYLSQQCVGVSRPIVRPDSLRSGIARDTTAIRRNTPAPARAEPTPVSSPKPGAATGPFSVQVAAYNTTREAQTAVARLVAQGHEARVDGDVKPFRVRIGRYATRATAATAQARLKAKGHNGFVVRTDGK